MKIYGIRDGFSMELVETKVHKESCPHAGACAQYDEIFGGKYDHYKKG